MLLQLLDFEKKQNMAVIAIEVGSAVGSLFHWLGFFSSKVAVMETIVIYPFEVNFIIDIRTFGHLLDFQAIFVFSKGVFLFFHFS